MTNPALHRRALIAGALSLSGVGAARAPAVDAALLVRTLAALVEREYPDPALARTIAASLRSKLKAGRYRGLAPAALAVALTEDLRAVGHDQHLKVAYDPRSAEHRSPADSPPPQASRPAPREPSARAKAIFGPQNYGITRVDILPGNIGLLQIDNFVPLYGVTRERYGAAMGLLADTYGLVLDLRANGGGASDTPAHLMSYFFDREPFVLDRLAWRRIPAEEDRTTRDLAGPNYGEQRPLMVAIGPRTFSAAEATAYDLQAFKRAVVVGETSRGGANPGDFFNLGQGFEAFTPQGRAVNPVTGGNWEGVGVKPDIPAPAADAVKAAQRAAIEAALTQTTDADRIEVLREGLAG